MYARVVTVTGADNINDGVAFLREKVVPTLMDQKGYRSLTASADRSARVFEVQSSWETAADRDASESAAGKLRHEALGIFGGEFHVEHFQEVLVDVNEPPTMGSALMATRVNMDPRRIEDNFAFFRANVLSRIKAAPGYCALRCMINRQTGHGLSYSVWTDEAAMQAWAASAQSLRQEALTRGVTLGDPSHRELLFVDLHEDDLRGGAGR
jgi:heme-degrading monooxygenase HmoA